MILVAWQVLHLSYKQRWTLTEGMSRQVKPVTVTYPQVRPI